VVQIRDNDAECMPMRYVYVNGHPEQIPKLLAVPASLHWVHDALEGLQSSRSRGTVHPFAHDCTSADGRRYRSCTVRSSLSDDVQDIISGFVNDLDEAIVSWLCGRCDTRCSRRRTRSPPAQVKFKEGELIDQKSGQGHIAHEVANKQVLKASSSASEQEAKSRRQISECLSQSPPNAHSSQLYPPSPMAKPV
jgi:hypothetical protein